MIREQLVVGPLQCNCILLGCERTKEAVLIDPGDEAERIIKEINEAGLTLKYLFHTHGHFDHIAATKEVRETLGGTTCLHAGDELMFHNLPMQGKMFGMHFKDSPKVEKHLEDGEIYTFGDYSLEVIHTPGHSPGSVSLKLRGGNEDVFSGDTLFRHSIGRADLWGGDGRQLIRSIKERLFPLNDDIEVHPGHGPSTTIGIEKRENPFLI